MDKPDFEKNQKVKEIIESNPTITELRRVRTFQKQAGWFSTRIERR